MSSINTTKKKTSQEVASVILTLMGSTIGQEKYKLNIGVEDIIILSKSHIKIQLKGGNLLRWNKNKTG